jgi:hypothetical protein
MARFLSDEWFADAQRLLGAVRAPDDVATTVQFAAGDDTWHLSATPGEPVRIERGAAERGTPELRWSRADALSVWRRERRGEAALGCATVRHGDYEGTPAPGDLAARPELRDMPELPGATITVLYDFRDGPFGAVQHVLFFEDGRVGGDQWGPVEHPDVTVHVPYHAISKVRSDEWGVLDAMEHGSIEGELGPLAMLAGVLESPEFHLAEQATSTHAVALGGLGLLDADPEYAKASEDLAAITDAD